jgi:hypothetical protein
MPTKLTARTLLPILIIAAGLFYWSACKTKAQECYQNVIVRNNNNFSFRYLDTVRNASDTPNITYDSVMKFSDTALKSPEMTVINPDTIYPSFIAFNSKQLAIPLDPAKDSIQFKFRTDTLSNVYDTITYFYTPVTHFINNGCGYTYYYNLNNVKLNTKNMIDSASIITKTVSDKTTQINVNLYFKKRP